MQGVITGLLSSYHGGDREALEEILRLVLPELRRVARHMLRTERKDHILQPTALVNEAFLRLFDGSPIPWENSRHFIRSAAGEMRRVLVDYARRAAAAKRHHDEVDLRLDSDGVVLKNDPNFYVDLDRALTALAGVNERAAEVVELKSFGDLTSEEIAAVLDISVRTVNREWRWARAWLRRYLESD